MGGRTEICMVLRADREKGYIDLSKRRVDPDDAKAKDESFAKAKAVYGIMRHVASLHDIPADELSNKVAWPLQAKYQDAHEACRKHINEEICMWDEIDFSQPGMDLSAKAEDLKKDLETSLRRRLITQALRMRAKVEVSCSAFEGIDAIKAAMMKGLQASVEDCEIKAKLIAHPLFMLTCTCRDKQLGLSTLDEAMRLIQESIEAAKGEFNIKTRPELIGENDREEDDEGSSEDDADAQSDSTEGDQDETMGNIDEKVMAELMEKTKDLDENAETEDN